MCCIDIILIIDPDYEDCQNLIIWGGLSEIYQLSGDEDTDLWPIVRLCKHKVVGGYTENYYNQMYELC